MQMKTAGGVPGGIRFGNVLFRSNRRNRASRPSSSSSNRSARGKKRERARGRESQRRRRTEFRTERPRCLASRAETPVFGRTERGGAPDPFGAAAGRKSTRDGTRQSHRFATSAALLQTFARCQMRGLPRKCCLAGRATAAPQLDNGRRPAPLAAVLRAVTFMSRAHIAPESFACPRKEFLGPCKSQRQPSTGNAIHRVETHIAGGKGEARQNAGA